MSLIHKTLTGAKILKAKVFNQKRPFSVNLSLTNRCNLDCVYCSLPERGDNELTTEQILILIDQMAEAGVIKLGISGGEPLLRRDFDKIINQVKKYDIFTSLTTNGTLVKKWLSSLKKIDFLLISIDGPQIVHDQTGKANLDKLLENILILKEHKVNLALSCVLTKPSIENLDYLFNLSKTYNVGITFHPFTYLKFLSITSTKSCDIAPTPEELKKAILRIRREKIGGALVYNSFPFLDLVGKGENFDGNICLAGERFCYIDTNGDVYPCSPMTERMPAFNAVDVGFKNAFNQIPCFSCGTGCSFACYVDYNYLFSLNWRLLPGLIKVYRNSKNTQKLMKAPHEQKACHIDSCL